ncbi:hypothetical protein [Imperialibacter roseus]|uniref:Uncharacterized protein n=1 Tax=Imperialibacter roseus TaxID=1324217 RepID=A0ABZ0II58_9BACT|nr:hypothetical protein [Imperialibacter roseus]WOK04727.1 hypothetical protein RT717_16725 [Imperialibacter roseus]|tara:strand:+ start:7303 stop:7908 length:606 start_codon:yes stop_codon:yes gene_type:complete
MEFEQLTSIWNNANPTLDQTVKINKELVKTISFSKVKSSLSEIKWTSIFQIVVGIWFLDFLLGFAFRHHADHLFLIPSIMLIVITLYSLIFDIGQLVMLFKINAKASVAEAQRKLSLLKKLEAYDAYSLLVIIPLFSAPFLIVVAKAAAEVSLYEFGNQWIYSYVAGSAVVAGIVVFFLRMFPNKGLQESIDFLKELKEEK